MRKYIWPILFLIVVALLCQQTYQTYTFRKKCTELTSELEDVEEYHIFRLQIVNIYSKLVDKLCLEHNKHISIQSIKDFFTYNDFCYVAETAPDNEILLDLIKEKEYQLNMIMF